MEYADNHYAVDLITSSSRKTLPQVMHGADLTLVNGFALISPESFSESLQALITFIGDRGKVLGWYRQGIEAFLGTAVIETDDETLIAELEEQPFVAPLALPGHPRLIGRASEMEIFSDPYEFVT